MKRFRIHLTALLLLLIMLLPAGCSSMPTETQNVVLNVTSKDFTSLNETLQLEATVEPENAENKNITFLTSNEAVAKVDANGLVTPVGEGTAVITARAEGGRGVGGCVVRVRLSQDAFAEESADPVPLEDVNFAIDVFTFSSESDTDGYKRQILGYSALVDWDKTGGETVSAVIELNVQTKKDDGFRAVAEEICAYPEVTSLYLMSGGYDFAVMVEGRSMKQIASFVFEKLALIDGVTGTATHFVLNKYKEKNVVYGAAEPDDRELFEV